MNKQDILNSLEENILSITDQYGCPCQAKQLIQFIQQTDHLVVKEIGRKTFLLANTEFDYETKGFCQSYVALLSLTSELSLLPLTTPPALLKAG